MPYNTGNPLGSTNPKDLYDNAHNLDDAVNSDAYVWIDRFGNQRKSWAGIVEDFDGPLQKAIGQADRSESEADRSENEADRSTSEADRSESEADSSRQSALDSEQSAENAAVAAQSSGNILFYDNYSDADPDVASLPEGQIVEVLEDETRQGQSARYRVESGALVFKLYPRRMNSFGSPFWGHSKLLEQTDIDLNPMHPNSNYASLGPLQIGADTTLDIPSDTDYYIIAGTTVTP